MSEPFAQIFSYRRKWK